MVDLEKIVCLINMCGDALNRLEHGKAAKLIEEIDSVMANRAVPIQLIYHRLILSAELYGRTGDYKKALDEFDRHRFLFDDSPELLFKLLIKMGRLEASFSRLKISTKYLTDALGLAENIGDKSLIAESYSSIARMFAPKYKGLAFYFFRKAERFYGEFGDNHKAQLERMERAFLSITSFLENRQHQNSIRLAREAERIVMSTKTDKFNPHEIRRFNYIKSVVTKDEDLLYNLISEMRECGALPDVCRYGEIYIGICIEKGIFEKAMQMFDIHKNELINLHGDSDELQQHLSGLKKVIDNQVISHYIPYSIPKNNEVRILDILDKYSYADELWALDDGPIRSLFPSYEQEGYFDALTMPDGTVRLYPCGIAFNVYYRGQAEYFEDSKPSLYRKNVTEAERFVERIKYEELKRCVEGYPLTEIFRSNVYWNTPDNKQKCLPLTIDHLALAQHYGIKTELMDITADKFVAAFFATTDYNDKDGYTPIVDNRKKPGVFYRCQNLDLPIPTPTKIRFRAVGLQPFSRPGEQAGLVYEMTENENFNDVVISKELFVHDIDASEFIYNYTNRSKKLFPYSPLESHADKIKHSHEFSTYAYEAAKDEFYTNVENDLLQSYLKEQGISISDKVDFSFSQEEKKACKKDWAERGDRETLSKIIVRPVFSGADLSIFGSQSRFK